MRVILENLAFKCEVNQYGRIELEDACQIKEIMKDGGLCILPSDSSYILTGLLTVPGVTKDLDVLLERHGLPMSLAFGSLRQCVQRMDLSNMAYKFIKQLTPGGLTFVACPRNAVSISISAKRLNADGSIGARLSDSKVETQLAEYLDCPLPSTPIRNSNHTEISTLEEAFSIIADRITRLPRPRKIAAIDGIVPYPGRLSSVVKEEQHNGCWHIIIMREGAISFDTIQKNAIECQYDDAIVL